MNGPTDDKVMTATGEDLYKIIQLVEPVVEGHPKVHVVGAFLSMALAAMDPDITGDQLQEGIEELSKFMWFLLESNHAKSSSQKSKLVN